MHGRNHRIESRLSLLAALAMSTPSACAPDVPACPGQCFEYTVEQTSPLDCQNDVGVNYAISFTSNDPDGYRGRMCFNSTSVPLVVEAIDHLRAGGQLSDLSAETISAYVSTVNAVRSDLEAECILAAPGQCTNAAEVCSVLAADAYAELVIEQACTLSLAGTESVVLAPGQTCEPLTADATGTADGDHCLDATTTASLDNTTTGLDDTSSDSGRMAGAGRLTP